MPKMENMFFEFRYIKTSGNTFCISCDSEIISDRECYAAEYAGKLLKRCLSNRAKQNI